MTLIIFLREFKIDCIILKIKEGWELNNLASFNLRFLNFIYY